MFYNSKIMLNLQDIILKSNLNSNLKSNLNSNKIYSSPITKPYFPSNPDEDLDVMEEDDVANSNQDPCKVILFNDEIHTFDEVSSQIILATKCSAEKAEALTWEVHSKGKAIVFSGDMNECLRVSGILEEIALNTQIEM